MLIRLLKDIYFRPRRDREQAEKLEVDDATDCERWGSALLRRMFELMHSYEEDNFDADRYRGIAPNAFFPERHAWNFMYVLKNIEYFYQSRMLFADEPSRMLFDQLLLFRVLGHMHVRLPFNTPKNREQVLAAEHFRVQDTKDVGAFGPLSIYDVPGNGQNIRIKGWRENVIWTFLYRQYDFERAGVRIAVTQGDRVVDGGGCFGDTALRFADIAGDHGHVYVFDPLPKHCAIMREAMAMNPSLANRITIFAAGLSDVVNDIAPMPEDDMINPGARIVADQMPTTTIDSIVAANNVPRIDFIKMDIEGSELGALNGAEAAIRRWRPKLAISLYHRPEDFFSIPLWIEGLALGYKLYLDHYTIHSEETVLYATV